MRNRSRIFLSQNEDVEYVAGLESIFHEYRVFIAEGNDVPCAFTTEAADYTPASVNIGAGAEPWRSGRCFSVYLG